MKIIVLIASMLLYFLFSCVITQGMTTQEKINQIKAKIDQRTHPMTKEDVISMLGHPVKTQILVGVYYMLYETEGKEFYLFVVDEHNEDIGFKKVDPNDRELVNLFSIKVNTQGIPLDDQGRPITPIVEDPQKIKDYDKATEPNQKLAEKFNYLGMSAGISLNAIEYYDKAIELNPNLQIAYVNRAHVHEKLGNYQEAIMDFERAIELKPQDPRLFNSVAWLLATCKRPEYRDGKKAVEYAKKAILLGDGAHYLSDNNKAAFFNTLAAAYAEVGDFDNAVLIESKAYDLYKPINAEGKKQKYQYKELMEAYKNKKTYLQWESK